MCMCVTQRFQKKFSLKSHAIWHIISFFYYNNFLGTFPISFPSIVLRDTFLITINEWHTFFRQRFLTEPSKPPSQKTSKQRKPIGVTRGRFSGFRILVVMIRRHSTSDVIFFVASELFDHRRYHRNGRDHCRVVISAVRRHVQLFLQHQQQHTPFTLYDPL